MYMLQHHGLTVSNDSDVLYDHGRLMHYVMHGATTMPSGAMMDEDYAGMLQDMGGPDTGNMVPQLRRHFEGQNLYDPDHTEEHQTDMWKIDERTDTQHEYEMLTPTAPDRSSDEEAPTHGMEERTQMIQCTVHPAHATNNGVWILAVMGAVTATIVMVITVTMMWMATQGYAITGVWLTITPTRTYQREHNDDMALH